MPTVSTKAAMTMVGASVFIAISTFLAKGAAGRFESISEDGGIHPLQVTASRFLFAWLLWVVVVAIRRVPFQTIHWKLHIIRSFFGWATVTCLFWASANMALSDATAISFLTPVVTLVLAVLFLNERVGPVRWSAVAIMLTGALILLRPGTSAFQPMALVALCAAVTSGFEATIIKRITALEPRIQILFLNNTIGTVIAITAALAVWTAPTPMQWLVLFGVGMSMSGAQIFFLTSMRDGDASYVVPFMYSTLIFASVLDFWVFGDRPDLLGFVGALVIVAGAVFLALREGAKKRAT